MGKQSYKYALILDWFPSKHLQLSITVNLTIGMSQVDIGIFIFDARSNRKIE
jgi:hypothetical protein